MNYEFSDKMWPDAPEEITILKARVNELEKMLEKAKREKIIFKNSIDGTRYTVVAVIVSSI